MHHEEIELNFDASCQQIIGLESEILWEARSTPTLVPCYFTLKYFDCYNLSFVGSTILTSSSCCCRVHQQIFEFDILTA
jgi:hypothetical protein